MSSSPSDAASPASPGSAPAVLADAAARGARYLAGLDARPVAPSAAALEALRTLGGPLPAGPSSPEEVLRLLDEAGSPATVATAGRRYFGFVIGGTLPAALGANVLAAAWDQVAGMACTSPVAATLERVAGRWVVEALGFDPACAVGFTTGATMANLVGLAAARHALLARRGWDVERDGLFGAPEFPVIVGDEVHVSALKALGILGLGRERVRRVPVDGEGRLRAEALPAVEGPALVLLQAGNVNSGAFDPAREVLERLAGSGSWVHVDGAFGLWAAAAPARAHLMAGYERADSWAVDAHKWLNVPYDAGIALCRHPESMRAAMRVDAAYLARPALPEANDHTPEMSRRARAVEVWAALRSLGHAGLAELVEGCCRHATRFAEGLRAAGHEILNEVRLNQVLAAFGSDAATERVIEGLQAEGTLWAGGTTWHGRRALRLSVSSWATREEDVERALATILRLAGAAGP